MKKVGTIKELNLYPVKSMAVLSVETAQLYLVRAKWRQEICLCAKEQSRRFGVSLAHSARLTEPAALPRGLRKSG